MTRERAQDYGAKHQFLLDSAAALFAEVGYPSVKLQDVAERCGVSKSMLYHYFPTKADLLLALLREHLEQIIADIEGVLAQPGSAQERFVSFVEVYVQKSAGSRQRHVSAMNDVKFLPAKMQRPLLKLEAQAVELVAVLLKQLNPGLGRQTYKPYALLLLGMLNWTDLWYKGTGKIKPDELCERIARLFLRGFLAERA